MMFATEKADPAIVASIDVNDDGYVDIGKYSPLLSFAAFTKFPF
jgi:hypothetical protein